VQGDDVLVDNDVVQQVKRTADRVVGTPPVRWMPQRAWKVASRPAGPMLRLLGPEVADGRVAGRLIRSAYHRAGLTAWPARSRPPRFAPAPPS
jgi:hypothetical protein